MFFLIVVLVSYNNPDSENAVFPVLWLVMSQNSRISTVLKCIDQAGRVFAAALKRKAHVPWVCSTYRLEVGPLHAPAPVMMRCFVC